jgi:N-acetylglucosamine-6-sulfatase
VRRTKRRTAPSTRGSVGKAGRWIVICALLTGVLVTPGQGSNDPSSALADVRPNIVIVITDDQRADQLARMAVTTSELAGNGVRFDQAFASHPLCCPARATILRGQYAHTTGIYLNEGNRGGWAVFRDRGLEKSTLATWLQGTGYRTGLVGKYLNGYEATTNYVPPGWDFWRGGAPAYYNRGGAPTYATNLLTRYADEFVRGTPTNTPLFLYLAYLVPHEPSKPAPQYATDPRCNGISTSGVPSFNEADVSDKPSPVKTKPLLTPSQRTYIGTTLPTNQCRALLSVDDGVAAMLRALRDTGRLGNTFFVFMSDHGLFLGEHRIQATKILTYEEAIRIPLVIRYDPLTAGLARRDGHLVVNVDLAPTIADLVGLDVTPGCPVPPYGACGGGFDGRSLLPILEGSATGWRNDFLVENHRSCGVRNDRYLFSRHNTGEEELYDLAADPYQLSNLLAGTPMPEVRALRQQLLTRLKVLCSPPPPGVRF